MSDVNCAHCGQPIRAEVESSKPRRPCPHCGSTARVFYETLTESIAATDSMQATVLRLSVDTSAAAVQVMTTMGSPEGMNDFWGDAAELRHRMLLNHGSDQALRAIATGAFDPAPQYPFDEPTKAIARYVAAEELHARRDAAERDRATRDNLRDQRRSLWKWMSGAFAWLLRIFKG